MVSRGFISAAGRNEVRIAGHFHARITEPPKGTRDRLAGHPDNLRNLRSSESLASKVEHAKSRRLCAFVLCLPEAGTGSAKFGSPRASV